LFDCECGAWVSFVDAGDAYVSVSILTRYKNVSLDFVCQNFRGSLYRTRQMPGRVNDRIPLSPSEFTQLTMSITLDALDRPETFSRIISPIKKRNLMPARLCRGNEMSPQESRSTENQHPHAVGLFNSRWLRAPCTTANTSTRDSSGLIR
jgi:hypothetical protein